MDFGADDSNVTDQTVGGAQSVASLVNPYEQQPAPVDVGTGAGAPHASAPFTYDPNSPGPVSADGVPLLPLLRRLEGSGDDAVSPAGAIGRYQVVPRYWPQFDATRLKDPDYNTAAATYIVGKLNDQYNGDADLVAIGYNGGPKEVQKYLAAGRDPGVLPVETQKYLAHARELMGSATPAPSASAPGFGGGDAAPSFGAQDSAPASPFGQGDNAPAAPTKPGVMEEAGRLGASLIGGAVEGAGNVIHAAQTFGAGIQAADIERDYNAVESGDAAATGWTQAQQNAAVRAYRQLQKTGAGPEPHPRAQAAISSAAAATTSAGEAISPTNRHGLESVLHGAGEVVPALAFGAVDSLAGAAVFGAQGYDEAAQEAARAGKTPAQQRQAGMENAGVQAEVGLIPFAKPLEPFVKGVTHPITAAIAKAGVHSAGDAVMMGTMQAGSNVVAEQNYDPNRPITQGVGTAALTGLAAGALIHGGRESFNAATGRLRPAEAAPGPNGEAPTAPMPATDAIEKYIGDRQAPVQPDAEAPPAEQPIEPAGLPAETPAKTTIEAVASAELPRETAELSPPVSPAVDAIASDVPAPILGQAATDVDEYRAAAPKGYSLFSAIKDLGGMRVKEADGSATAGPDVQGALEDVKRKPPGMINNKAGMSPEQMQEALADRGWLPADDPEALVNALQKEGSGQKVYHPDADTPTLEARRHVLDHEMTEAGVSPTDTPDLAAAKLAAWRYGEINRGTAQFEILRARADELGVDHDRDTSYSDLLGDVIEREAIQAEPSETDAHEREIHGNLTEADLERLDALAAEGLTPEHGTSPAAYPLPEGWETEPGVPESYSGSAEGAGGGGEGPAAAAGEAASLKPSASWVVVDRATGKPVLETFERKTADRVNRDRYEVVPAKEWLERHNRAVRENGGVEPPDSASAALTERVRLANETADQAVIPGAERSARQAAASREGPLRSKARQEEPGGLFAPPAPEQPLLFGHDDSEPKMARAPYYSAVERFIDKFQQKAATPDQWKATLRNATGVKKEELDWLGVDDWLDLFKGEKVPKEALQAFLRDNGVHVDEVELGKPATGPEAPEDASNPFSGAPLRGERYEEGLAPQFEDWKLPGGEDYRELLLTLPSETNPPATHWDTPGVLAHVRFDTRTAPDGKKVLFVEEVQSDWHQKGRDQGYATPADPKLVAAAEEKRQAAGQRLIAASSTEGSRITQWLRGVGVDEKYIPALDGPEDVRRAAGSLYASPDYDRWKEIAPEAHAAFAEAHNETVGARLAYTEARQHAESIKGTSGIANAPFKSSWPALVMKRVIKWAVDHGYERVAWTTGDQQADRYDLSKEIHSITFHDNNTGGRGRPKLDGPDGPGMLTVRDRHGSTVLKEYVNSPAEIEGHIGKELTDRLLGQSAVASEDAGMGARERRISGLDVKMGGEGMRAFYDRNLVNITNDLVKKYGAKVEQKAIADPKIEELQRYAQLDADKARHAKERLEAHRGNAGLEPALNNSYERARENAARSAEALRQAQERGQAQHGFDVTEKMKEAAAGGMALFARKGERTGAGLPEPRVHPAVTRTPAEADSITPKERRLMAKVDAEIERIAPATEVRPYRSITERLADGEEINALGMYHRDRLRHIISYALEGGDGVRVARHEAIHALKASGVIKPEEWDALSHAAVSEGWIEKYRIPERYGELTHEEQIEEAIAEHFASWKRQGLKGAPSFVNEAFTRIQQFLAHVADLARRVMGRGVTADDVLSRIERGEVGSRPLGGGEAAVPKFARLLSAPFKRWFANSKVVDQEGRPLVVYHGTNQPIERFSAERLGANTRHPTSREGYYFTDKPSVASTYAEYSGKNQVASAVAHEAESARLEAEVGRLERVARRTGEWDAYEQAMQAWEDHDIGGIRAEDISGQNVVPVYLSMQNPMEINVHGGGLPLDMLDQIAAAKAAGHDGIILRDIADPPPERSDHYVVFDPSQIKSTMNSGSYDAADPRISFARKPIDEETMGTPGIVNRILGHGAAAAGRKLVAAADKAIPDPVAELLDQGKMAISPMGTGSERAQASAKDFANALRQSAFQWGKMDEWLEKTYTPEERKLMWEAADEHGVLLRRGVEPGEGQGLNLLTDAQRGTVEAIQARADTTFKHAQDLGMVTGEGLESYVPRMVVEMTTAGPKVVSRATPKQAKRGANLSTTTGQLRQRKYETVEETEGAAKKAFGEGATVVRDIRTLALATQRLEQAVAGRTLVDKIKAMSKDAGGGPLVAEGANPDPNGYFTMEGHPALTQWAPKMVKDAETGKWVPAIDQNGDPVFEANPLWISKEFEGPLKAVLSTPSSGITRALMNLKAKMMSVIMYSPLMHNAVIWGKAIPADPVGVLTLQAYRRGNLARKDTPTMLEAIGAGMDPIGHRYFNQDIAGIAAAEGLDMQPGRSWTSQALAFVPGLFDREAGEAVKRAVDKFGDVWHNTFLWDRIADLQAGLYVHVRDGLLAKGVDELSAQRTAAHFANRYAGALPMEGMSKAARNIANIMLFSRSFTLGNMAAYKDMVMGLPSDVRAQIVRDGGLKALEGVQGVARQKAVGMLVLDVALQFAGLTMASLATAWLTHETVQFPWQNEVGKQNRFLIGYQPDGTAIYGRLPTGKVAEDLTDWALSPRETLLRKLSPYGRLMYEMASNDKGFGQHLYDPYDHTPLGLARNIGRVTWEFMGGIAPLGQIQGLQAMISGGQDKKTAALQALAPFTGLTISKGAPGGPAQADLYAAADEQKFRWNEARPAVVQQIKQGDIAGARAKMTALGVPPGLQGYEIRVALNPKLRMSARQVRDFLMYATPEQKAQFETDRSAQQQRAAGQP